jgi:hypothetical protein
MCFIDPSACFSTPYMSEKGRVKFRIGGVTHYHEAEELLSSGPF